MQLFLDNVTKRYGNPLALDGFTYSFAPGIYGILGANGAGKSTMMNLITDNLRRDGGDITYDGTEIRELGAGYRKLLGYMTQEHALFEGMTAESFLVYMCRLKDIPGKIIKDEVSRVLQQVNLEDERHNTIDSFSGGMKQRMLLAQSLLGDPKILILDEPTSGLDPKERVRFRNNLKDISKDRIVLLATHIVSDLEAVADEILLLKKGRLLKSGTPEELIESLPEDTVPVLHSLSLEDVYLYYLGEDDDA
ncbi:MAG: ATP-binding cassette domain-containing protein [Oscillospiraceae bacterium]|nr:ATP-binding cassette domain-containing protein [Oscillospiraceae bacterium]